MQVMVESVNQWARWMLGLAQREYWMGVLCFVTPNKSKIEEHATSNGSGTVTASVTVSTC